MKNLTLFLCGAIFSLILVWGYSLPADPKPVKTLTSQTFDYTFSLNGAEEASSFFDLIAGTVGRIKKSEKVAPIFSQSIPTDIGQGISISQRRELFVRLLLPNIIQVNDEIEEERKFIK